MMDITEWLRKEAELVALDRLNEAADEIDRLRKDVGEERALKQGWIDEYMKLRDMGEMPEDS